MSTYRQLRLAFLTPNQTLPQPRHAVSNVNCTALSKRRSSYIKQPVNSFMGRQLFQTLSLTPVRVQNAKTTRAVKMIVDPWSVSPEAVDALAAQFFAASLAPYLVFLYFLAKKETDCPPLANFGFRFLLVFVFATIPAGIYAKVHYHDILANVDWLHGAAESFLTVTNLLIVLGFRNAMSPSETASVDRPKKNQDESSLQLRATVSVLIMPLASMLLTGFLSLHAEPSNALSFPTWVIHVSSLVEWLVAMGLIWQYADVANNPKWKGLTWGMLPLHSSGICACTYHFFYNAANLNVLVAVQAALTCFGNATMAAAAFRISRGNGNLKPASAPSTNNGGEISLTGFEDMATRFAKDSNTVFFGKVLAISLLGSAAVKWGSLTIDAPFEHSLILAFSIIIVPTLLNMTKWFVRSAKNSSDFGGFL